MMFGESGYGYEGGGYGPGMMGGGYWSRAGGEEDNFDGPSATYLDPADTKVYVGHETPDSDWLEFRTTCGISVVVERPVGKGGSFTVTH